MKTLLLYELESPELLDMLDDERFAYGDNGGSPDGNALLPGKDGVVHEVAERVVSAGYGELVEVGEATDEDMVRLFGWNEEVFRLAWEHDPVEVIAIMKDLATLKGLRWAHYGAYGAEDSYWVYVKKDNV